MYKQKSDIGLQEKGLQHSIMVFPLKNLSALWLGKKNWKEESLMIIELCLQGSRRSLLSGHISSPRDINAKKPTHSWVQKRRSSCVGLWEWVVHTKLRSAIVRARFLTVGVPHNHCHTKVYLVSRCHRNLICRTD